MHRIEEEEELIIIGEIIAKRSQGIHLTGAEDELLQKWLSRSVENHKIYQRCLDQQTQRELYTYFSSINVQQAFVRFKANRHRPTDGHLKKTLVLSWASYLIAASLLVVGIFGLYRLYFITEKPDTMEHTTASIDYAPAGNKATVTLSDGRLFKLDQSQNEIYIDDNGVNYHDGTLVAETASAVDVKITTPRGGLYSVTLPDGTHVKLNAGSELRYSTVFKEDSREVELNGEAYFEVAKQSTQPFMVKTSDQTITVLGTHFNVDAYEEASTTKTTLTEGKVRVQATATQAETILQPGQQSFLHEGELSKKDVDVEQELAWIYGKFNFDGKSLQEVMNDLSRWYNIDVVYEGSFPRIEFFGGTFRSSKLSTILSILESNDIQYRMTEDNKLVISNKK